MRGRNKTKSVAVESPRAFYSNSSENTIERHVFEKLCLDTSLRGFSYDPTLLVDLEKVSSFDEACIRITTKCGSIVTQLCSLGHNVTDFAVAAVPTATGTLNSPKTPKVPKIPDSPVSLFSSQVSPSSLYFLNSQSSPMLSPTSLAKSKFQGFDCMNKDTLTIQEKRNIRVMSETWEGLKKKSYTGMVAVARVMETSLPNNSSKDRYSVKALTDTLLGNVKGYFMFQNVSSTYDKDFHNPGVLNISKNNNNEPGREYLLYVVYRSKAEDKAAKKAASKHKTTEAAKLNSPWSADLSGSSRKLRHESGDSTVSSCSSISNTSGGPCSFSVPSGKPTNLKLEVRQDTIIATAMNKRGKFTNPQSFSTPPLRSTPTTQKRTLITPPSPTTSKTSPLQGSQGQKLFSPKSPTLGSPTRSPTFSQRNLRHHPYKQANSSPNLEPIDTVSEAINTAIASVSPKTQPQNLFSNQVKQQQNIPVKKQTVTQLDKKQQQQNKQTIQVQTHHPSRQQQKKSPETTAKAVFKNLLTPKRVPITAPKSESLTKNLRSSPAAPAPVSQRNLRHSFSKK